MEAPSHLGLFHNCKYFELSNVLIVSFILCIGRMEVDFQSEHSDNERV